MTDADCLLVWLVDKSGIHHKRLSVPEELSLVEVCVVWTHGAQESSRLFQHSIRHFALFQLLCKRSPVLVCSAYYTFLQKHMCTMSILESF